MTRLGHTTRYALVSIVVALFITATAWGQDTERNRLRVLTYNIHHGRGMDDVFDYERLARIITELEPDLVALQEVDRGVRRSGRVDQATILGELTGLHHAFGNALYYQGGEYGEALLSRFPLDEVKAHHLPFQAGLEPRTALAARVRPGGGLPDLVFVGTHLCHQREDVRTEQTKHLNALFTDVAAPVIMAGDLNARPGSPPMDTLLAEHWVDAIAPQSRIDYVLYRRTDPWHVVEVQIVDERVASDHRPVLAVLEWRGPAPAETHQRVEENPRPPRPEIDDGGLVARFRFDGPATGGAGTSASGSFVNGLSGGAMRVRSTDTPSFLALEHAHLPPAANADFSVQFWMRTVAPSDRRFVVLSQKDLADNSLASQKQAGWVFYVSHGTWAWNMGSGNRRITYERDNGRRMPLNDGRWHQLTMTYDAARSLVRLFYDGHNWVTYNIRDSSGFDFTNPSALTVGWHGPAPRSGSAVLPAIAEGAAGLQELVDAFNDLGVTAVAPDELMQLVIDPRKLFDQKSRALDGTDDAALLDSLKSADLQPVEQLADRLMRNPYTVHQVADFMKVAPLLRLYRLVDGRIGVNQGEAAVWGRRERSSRPDFDIDELTIRDRVLSPEEVLGSYARHFQPTAIDRAQSLSSLTAACWNIHHGGIHETLAEDGWDSRQAIAELIRRENVDIVMMQETYSNGDFIAAELGYYFATTVDWDYLNQGANISVLSRYPITDVHVPASSPFMNVAARIVLSRTQDVYAMSNWYGMRSFPDVFAYHESRFADSARTPILFAGDFNAVPHTDGGDSPASRRLLEAGFTDAYRQTYPDVERHPGPTHDSGQRIDQLYFKGAGLTNISTTVLSTWPSRFPSDHFMIKTVFDLDYASSSK